MSVEEAAVFRGAHHTAYHALVQRGRLQAGEWVLIHGAAGGIGIAAIQVAKLFGAKVIATASTDEKRQVCLEEGADYAIDYREGFRDRVKEITGAHDGVDVCYDPIGAHVFDESLRCLAFGGRILVLGFLGGGPSTPRTNYLLIKCLEVIGVRLGGATEHKPEIGRANTKLLVELASQGKLRPRISHRFPLERAADAIQTVIELARSDPEAKRALAHAKSDHDLDFIASQSPYVAQLLGRPRTQGDDWCIAAENRARAINVGNFISLAEEAAPLIDRDVAYAGIPAGKDPEFVCAVKAGKSELSITMYVALTPKAKPERIVTIAWEIFSDGFFDADAFVDEKHDKTIRLQNVARVARISHAIASGASL